MNLLSILMVILVLVGASVKSERPGRHGFEPAFLKQQPEFDRITAVPSIAFTREIDMIMDIDAQGVITSARSVLAADSLMVTSLIPQLRGFKLEPARLDGNPVSSLLATHFLVAPRMQYPEVCFPVGPEGDITNPDLCRETYRLNGLEPSELVSFPSYFYLDDSRDSLGKSVPSVLFRLDVNTTGKISSSEMILSSAPGFDRQVKAALLRAVLHPARIKGVAIPSVAWLVISFYPNVSYPTMAWEKTEGSELPFLDQIRLRLLPDTLGLMQLPTPRRPQGSAFSFKGDHAFKRDTVAAILLIDTLGQVALTRADRASVEVQAALRRAATTIKFHPAVGFDGHPRSFTGRAFYEFTGSNTIRIRYDWLTPPPAPISSL